MLQDALLAYAHYFSIIATAALLVAEAALCRPTLNRDTVKRLGQVDLLYLGAAIFALTTGLLRVFFGIKGSAFYLHNPVFYVKIGLFILVALISIAPTLQFIRWARAIAPSPDNTISLQEITKASRFIYVELGILALLPLCGALMARGFGY
ncbi:DUF2214 family protein [soil metagenome]